MAGLLPRLRESGITATLAVGSAQLAALDLAQRLDLYRLAGNAAIAEAASLPLAGAAPLLALVAGTPEPIAIAAPDAADAIPGAGWGQGGRAVLVRGPAPYTVTLRDFDSRRLVSLPSGNAWLLRLGDRLDGPVSRFGRAFWDAVERDAPRVVAAMRGHRVRSIDYTDRYLVTPLALRLLVEVLTALPGDGGSSRVRVATARLDPREQTAWAIHHGFAEDAQRRQVLKALLPRGAVVEIRPKAELPHARRLLVDLEDGSRVTLLLDQGFGGWRSAGSARHDFRADPARQAHALHTAKFDVRVETASEAPLILEISATRGGA